MPCYRNIIDSNHKRCTACSEVFPLDGFHRDRKGALNRNSRCKTCVNRIRREHESNSHYRLCSNLQSKYGITYLEYLKLLEDQEHLCKVCRSECRTGQRLAVDHCHTTGAVRGLLCFNCNAALGNVRDSIDVLHNLINYLLEGEEVKVNVEPASNNR